MKKVLTVLYFILVAVALYFVAYLSEASKVQEFLKHNEELFMNDKKALIAGTIIANHHDSTDVYVQNEPLYQEYFEASKHSIEISIFPLVSFKDKKGANSLAIVLTEILIEDGNAALSDNEYNIIYVNIQFDRNIQLGGQYKDYVTEVFTESFDNTMRILVIPQDKLETSTGYAKYKSISVSYQASNETQIDLVILSNPDINDSKYSDLFDEAYNRNINKVTPSNIDLLSKHGLTDLTNNLEIYYNPKLVSNLNYYNIMYLEYMGVSVLIILVLTYFIYFHKYVKIVIKNKKKLKKEKEAEIRNEMSNMNQNNDEQ